jgi:2,3-bisphosphoglycerate-dependent phosphoglycerate mutase
MDRLLVLVRHGQSDWNLKNLFTGWKDPDLTPKGVEEAKAAGQRLKALGLSFDTAFTSDLTRAQNTLKLVMGELGQPERPDHPRSGAERTRLWRSLRPQQGRRPQEMG